MGKIAAVLGLLSQDVIAKALLRGKKKTSQEHFVRAMEFKHRLRVCNAYPYSAALDVFLGKSEKLTEDQPLAYKGCRDFKTQLKSGDKIEFRIGDANAGTFSVSDLPSNDAVLFLAIYRHDTLSTAVSFESHVFANLLNAQIAVIDTYQGSKGKGGSLKIEDFQGTSSRSEELRYDSVVAVNPGHYEAILADGNGAVQSKQELVTLNRESYVVLRVGVEAQEGESFPQEIMVFPQSDASLLGSAFRASDGKMALMASLMLGSVMSVFFL